MNVMQIILRVLLQDKNLACGEFNERGFSNPHPWYRCVLLMTNIHPFNKTLSMQWRDILCVYYPLGQILNVKKHGPWLGFKEE